MTTALGQRGRALDDVAHLAHVARPACGSSARSSRPARTPSSCRAAPATSRRKRSASAGMSSLALAHRRQLDVDDREPEVEILAERALVDLLRRSRLVAASTRTSTLMTRSPPTRLISRCSSTRSSFGCRLMSSSPISSRKIVPPCACSKQPVCCADRAGERALLVAEQRRLDQVARDRAAVEHDERLGLARRGVVDAARDHLLAGAGLAGDEHRQLRRRDLLERGEDLAHRERGAGDALEAVALRQLDLDDVLRRLELELVWPMRNTVPGLRYTSRTRSSPTKMPLGELRSRSR